MRGIVALALLISWSLVALTGFIIWFAPRGQGAGSIAFLLGLSRHEWGDIHFFISLLALVVTVIHVILDWRTLKGLIRYLIGVNQ
ncbi:putative 4-amino-4-deoxy-L-arabinose-phosphoundecaprenol flippase subunit ArnE [Planktothrix serta PCC 8927]|uniref:4-amino-4-deoxy-L-arabinose-phosphoundecaprenol flippase subunit ArnE n=2 Tax=Planktothrix TaxID=54304 RepID=A0A7Z9DVL4_9CYAN|nr:putative 4-amino-4-deoxy-L-arabinose-phosphoundecaprenol flippase subunit ArnE [Planktothrix serta PCC 8927]